MRCDLVSRYWKEVEFKAKLLETRTKWKNDLDRNVICVVGESGVGKTAFVRDFYESTIVRNKFTVCVWTSFPADTSDSMIVRLIYEQLFLECLSNSLVPGVEQRMLYEEHYKGKMHGVLQSICYLLVIDGSINNAQWKKVQHDLPEGGVGSKIVLIAPSCPANNGFEIHPLEGFESDLIFYRTVGIEQFTHAVSNQNISIVEIKAVTGGLPLVVVLLAKLLRTKERNKWNDVLEYIERSNEQADCFWMILSLIFNVLSDELKSCLLYFVGFPKHTVIDAHQLTRLWMAEGFLTTMNGIVEMEQLGQSYLKELISRGLVQSIKKDTHGHVELVAIHDHIHNFLRSEAQDTLFMEVHHGSLARAPVNARRLSLQNYDDKSAELTNYFRTLRSMLCYPKEDYTVQDERPAVRCCMACRQGPEEESSINHSKLNMVQLLQGSLFLRVIHVEGIDIGTELPKEIGGMVHLHYLSVRRCRSLKKVPKSIGRLTNLQTFDVRGTAIRKLPDSFWKIKSLRHVLGDELRFPICGGNLRLLQTLGTVSIPKKDVKGKFGTILRRKMSGLNSLHLLGLNNSHGRALQAALGKLALLVSLRLSGEVIPLDFTGRSVVHLEYMQLEGRLAQPASYTQCYINWRLTHLELKSTHVKQDFIDILASQPVLAVLMLLTGSYDEDTLDFRRSGFASLTLLRLSHIRLTKIVIKDTALQKLVRLELIGIGQDTEIKAPESYRIGEKTKWVLPLYTF